MCRTKKTAIILPSVLALCFLAGSYALGPGVKAGCRIEKPVPITAVAATGLEYLGLEASAGAEGSVWDLIT